MSEKIIKKIQGNKAEDILKEMFWLAWKSSGVFGMGVLQDKGDANKNEVWNNILNNGDYPGGSLGLRTDDNGFINIFADYVFGRMMKMSVSYNAKNNEISFYDNELSLSYQSWCKDFKSYQDLYERAIENVCE